MLQKTLKYGVKPMRAKNNNLTAQSKPCFTMRSRRKARRSPAQNKQGGAAKQTENAPRGGKKEKRNMKTYLGMDVGGTKLLIGEADGAGNVLRSKRYPTGYVTQQQAVQGILEAIDDYRETMGFAGEVAACGVGIIGRVDHNKGQWIAIGHAPEGEPVPLAEIIGARLGMPCAIDNDVRAAVTAELLLGCGRYSDDFAYLNVGTGLAAGFVCGRQILRGANVNAGEIGHTVVDMHSKQPCGCGRRGCAENAVSGIGFTYQVQRYNRPDLLNAETRKADTSRIFAMAAMGDEDCRHIQEYAADTLAQVIMNIVRVTDPDTLVYGGGILSNTAFLQMVKDRLDPETMQGVTNGMRESSFSPQTAGLLGAASLGMIADKKAKEREV